MEKLYGELIMCIIRVIKVHYFQVIPFFTFRHYTHLLCKKAFKKKQHSNWSFKNCFYSKRESAKENHQRTPTVK